MDAAQLDLQTSVSGCGIRIGHGVLDVCLVEMMLGIITVDVQKYIKRDSYYDGE